MSAITADRTTGQPSGAPIRKVASGGLAGAISVLLVWLYNTYVSPGLPLSADLAATLTTVLIFIVSYFVPPASSEVTQAA